MKVRPDPARWRRLPALLLGQTSDVTEGGAYEAFVPGAEFCRNGWADNFVRAQPHEIECVASRFAVAGDLDDVGKTCLLYTSPSPRD